MPDPRSGGGDDRPLSERVSAALASAGQQEAADLGPRGSSLANSPPPAGAPARTPPRAEQAALPPEQSAVPPEPSPPRPAPRPKGRTRKARLRVVHVDPWSVMKTSFLLSIAIGIVTVVAVAVVWSVLGAAGLWDSIDKTVGDVVGNGSSEPFHVQDYLGMSRVMGFTMLVAVVDVVLITVIATLGAFLYNLAAALLGGLEVILAEED